MSFLKGINQKPALPKLVRDNIPRLIKESGKEYIVTVVSDPMIMVGWLAEKVKEELKEYREANKKQKLEEAADMYEACLALWSTSGLGIAEIAAKAEEKAKEKGKFSDGIILWDIIDRKLKKV
tara:strand:+ start:4757 stop:5125 length:369 start_codon:yes stop_codon:yes gene_type:complete